MYTKIISGPSEDPILHSTQSAMLGLHYKFKTRARTYNSRLINHILKSKLIKLAIHSTISVQLRHTGSTSTSQSRDMNHRN